MGTGRAAGALPSETHFLRRGLRGSGEEREMRDLKPPGRDVVDVLKESQSFWGENGARDWGPVPTLVVADLVEFHRD
jgi:hypothetical protein